MLEAILQNEEDGNFWTCSRIYRIILENYLDNIHLHEFTSGSDNLRPIFFYDLQFFSEESVVVISNYWKLFAYATNT